MNEIEEVSITLSGRDDINDLYEEYGSTLYQSIDKTEEYRDGHDIWDIFVQQEEYSIMSLHESCIDPFLYQIEDLIQEHQTIFDMGNIKETIKNDMLKNVHLLSKGIWMAEVRNSEESENEYFNNLASDYKVFSKVIHKYSYWYLSLNKFLFRTTNFLIEFLKHLIEDNKKIMRGFFGTVGQIKNLSLSMGDRHNGKFVIEVITSAGNFFYKPRPAELDYAFKKVLDELSCKSEILDMKYPMFQDYKDHSWFKKVEYSPISSNTQEFKNYYVRLGQLLAIVYILNGGDLHYENIISYGEYPVIVDSEPLLTSRLRFKKSSMSKFLQNNTVNYTEDSVRNSFILPNVFSLRKQYFEFSPLKIYDESGPNTPEDSRKIFCHKVMKSDLELVSKYFSSGFIAVYQEISARKEVYTEYFVKLFENLKLRFLNRPTDDYAKIKDLLMNPICLFEFRYAFAISTKLFNFEKGNVKDEELLEQNELLQLDIPYFEIKANTRDLISPSNGVLLQDSFVETPIDGLAHKINLLGSSDLNRQIKIIREMFMVLSPNFKVEELNNVKLDNTDKLQISNQEIEEFIDESIHEIFKECDLNPLTNQCMWLGPELEGNLKTGQLYYHNVDYPSGYYTGNVGLLRGLLRLNNSSKYDNYIEKLIGDIEIDVNQLLDYPDKRINIGAYNGISQYLRYYINLFETRRVEKDYFIERADSLLDQIGLGISMDKKLDILDGTAGVSLAIIELYKMNVSDDFNVKVLKLLRKCYDHLVDSIVYRNNEYYFPFEQDKERHFTGFAHGTSGIIMALYKAMKILHQEDSEIISKLLHTERKYYNKIDKIWYKDNTKKDYSWGWCHGIPGILLSRLELLLTGYKDPYMRDEISELYDITVKKSMGSNLTFCHGDLGNIVICKYAQELLSFNDVRIDDYAKSLLPYLINSKRFKIRGTEAVGVMNGMMGVIIFMDTILTKKYTSLLDIIKITSETKHGKYIHEEGK